jgi:hypothetical protein
MPNEGGCGLGRPLNDRAHQRGTVAQTRVDQWHFVYYAVSLDE